MSTEPHLIECPVCGHRISSVARACISCGHPMALVPPPPKPSQQPTGKFCSSCRQTLIFDYDACPTCKGPLQVVNLGPRIGTSAEKTDKPGGAAIAFGWVFAALSFFLLPPLFGPIAIILGGVAFSKGNRAGIGVMLLGLVGTFVGMFFGAMIGAANAQ